MKKLQSKTLLDAIRSVSQNTFNVKTIVQNTKVNELQLNDTSKKITRKSLQAGKKLKKEASKIPGWYEYNKVFNINYDEPTSSEINSSNHFFNSADTKYEWSVGNFTDIPGEKLRKKYEARTTNSSNEAGLKKKYPGKTYVPFELVNGLPEVTFLGKSNVGKSTLLNNLTTDLKNSALNVFAKASKRAGFTKTLNSFNIGNRVRFIDTPGYGYRSSLEQGDLTTEYLLHRKELVRSFLLISGEQGIGELDKAIIDFMHQNGVPFEIVFTKMDKVDNLVKFRESIDESGLLNLPTLPRLIFTNAYTSKTCSKRYGVDLLRSIILQSCGLQSGLKSSRKKQK
ncbi:hypothetical protein HG535_0C03670 [Zygotorulaspora mrakii]|uniref:EngB-type G domain-containing protein n=1 Tax=Zygotorulaspora mrakii TaxID=42260 RepID=A0A7H9B0W5_ZYGMR|nr:uncharacterized protein HG535_0C03670 [Zygotorulaspora mrakii]QLG72014.1 hypothetical protein HG535_0C03670 [Zygotorulaspora mrakii]